MNDTKIDKTKAAISFIKSALFCMGMEFTAEILSSTLDSTLPSYMSSAIKTSAFIGSVLWKFGGKEQHRAKSKNKLLILTSAMISPFSEKPTSYLEGSAYCLNLLGMLSFAKNIYDSDQASILPVSIKEN